MIICPKCGGNKTEQSDTRQRPNTSYTWRRRSCKTCGHKFSTREYTLTDLDVLINSDGLGQDLAADQVTEIVEDLING